MRVLTVPSYAKTIAFTDFRRGAIIIALTRQMKPVIHDLLAIVAPGFRKS